MKPKTCKDYLALAREQSCVLCGSHHGVVSAHYTGLRQHSYGKGRGIKGNDLLTAHLCQSCHGKFDNPLIRKSIETSEEFLHAIALTLMRNTDKLVG